ncbi:LacI family DNA-binding transcriptional regulator [Polycladidibacter hongkongensis]|uniref:LacI family DNA-binding transcriptional regulator n=1 Tax=Polycladidibacter hongkongensis TaxID=1647556 RepID=UPI00082B639E|nr:LacI family DNA-binding transcriptional regulator [Pseudovibrio hongkongensis]
MAITLKDVAEKAGVSRSAVSRTFTPGASVSAKTRHLVEKAASELGYSPNVLARSLTTRRTSLIGLVSNNFHNPIFLQVFDLFTKGLQARGLRPLLVNLSEETDPQNSVRMLQQYSVDGVVVASSTLPPEFAMAFREARMPVVHSFGRYSNAPHVHVVGIDNLACGQLAAEELVARDYKRIGFLGGPAQATSTQDRLAGFERELSYRFNITPEVSYCVDYSFEAGRAKTLELLAAGEPCEAYFCGDDVISIGALSALRDYGLGVPDDVGIIGLNDMEMAGWENINLSTIHQPVQEIINSSVDLIAGMLDDPERYPEARLFPCKMIERGTLKPRI